MKRIVYYALVILVATLVLAALPTDAEAEIYEDTIRLHILANSDSKEDQALKIKIRDKLLIEYGEDLKKFGTKDEAEVKIKELLPEIERSAEEWIGELGYDYDVKAEIGVEWYETRDYGDFSLPCGKNKGNFQNMPGFQPEIMVINGLYQNGSNAGTVGSQGIRKNLVADNSNILLRYAKLFYCFIYTESKGLCTRMDVIKSLNWHLECNTNL